MKENDNKNSVELCVLCGEPEAVILANGDYPTHPIPLQILASAPYIVCCDGGADAYINRGNVPDVIIGDGDSLSEENRRKYSHILHYSHMREKIKMLEYHSHFLSVFIYISFLP